MASYQFLASRSTVKLSLSPGLKVHHHKIIRGSNKNKRYVMSSVAGAISTHGEGSTDISVLKMSPLDNFGVP